MDIWTSFTGAFSGTISFDWAPEPAMIAAQADAAAANLEDMTKPLHLAREYARANIEEHFDSKSGPDGAAWAPWSSRPSYPGGPSYADIAGARNVGGILERTGALRASATARSAFTVTAREVFYSISEPFYWIFHQEGANRSSFGREATEQMRAEGWDVDEVGNVLPARPFAGIDEKTQLMIVNAFDDWFEESISILTYGGRGGMTRAVVRGTGGRFGGPYRGRLE